MDNSEYEENEQSENHIEQEDNINKDNENYTEQDPNNNLNSFPVSPIASYNSNNPNRAINKNLNQNILSSSNSNSVSLSSIKCEQLYKLSKSLKKKREDIHQQNQMEKELKELEVCTFAPKINRYDKTAIENSITSNEILHKSSFTEYIEKKKKFREDNRKNEVKFENRIGSGKNWKKQVTVPEEFLISKNNFRKNNESESPKKSYSYAKMSGAYSVTFRENEFLQNPQIKGVKVCIN